MSDTSKEGMNGEEEVEKRPRDVEGDEDTETPSDGE
jgi:hypothetical protein